MSLHPQLYSADGRRTLHLWRGLVPGELLMVMDVVLLHIYLGFSYDYMIIFDDLLEFLNEYFLKRVIF